MFCESGLKYMFIAPNSTSELQIVLRLIMPGTR